MKAWMLFILLISNSLAYGYYQNINATKCSQSSTVPDAEFCIFMPDNVRPNNVLYVFHGIQGNKYYWLYHPKLLQLQKVWNDDGGALPIVVSISFGGVWLVSPEGKSKDSGLYEKIVKKIMPEIESHYLPQKVKERWLLGISMGGFNSLQIYLRHPQWFSKSAFLCPALTVESPFENEQTVSDYIQRTGASPRFVNKALGVSRQFFTDLEDWDTLSPHGAIANLNRPLNGKIYFSVGLEDHYGFHEGTQYFYNKIKQIHSDTQLVLLPGGHCQIDVNGLARFFM